LIQDGTLDGNFIITLRAGKVKKGGLALKRIGAKQSCARSLLVTVATADVWLGDIDQVFRADRSHLHAPGEAQETPLDTALQHQIGAGIGPQDAGDRAALAETGTPGLGLGVLINEAAFLPLAPAVVIFIVVAALLAGRCDHRSGRCSLILGQTDSDMRSGDSSLRSE
jgi:hypothetical protein